jgi:hypothetical protein
LTDEMRRALPRAAAAPKRPAGATAPQDVEDIGPEPVFRR